MIVLTFQATSKVLHDRVSRLTIYERFLLCEFASKIVQSVASTVCIGLLDKGIRFKGRDFVDYRKHMHLVLKSSRRPIERFLVECRK